MNESKFERFNLKPFIIESVKELGFFEPTEIQERLIPTVLKGDSVIGQSQTGTWNNTCLSVTDDTKSESL